MLHLLCFYYEHVREVELMFGLSIHHGESSVISQLAKDFK